MASEHLRCPVCSGSDVIPLRDLLWSMHAEYYRCGDCRSLWTVSTWPETTITLIARNEPRGIAGSEPATG
jgi:hypothetical protein